MTTTPQAALLSDGEVAQCINRARTNLFDRAGTASFRIARAIEQAVLAKLQPVQAGELPDEREAFEATVLKDNHHAVLTKRRNGCYQDDELQSMWWAWQARAALREKEVK